VVAQTERFDTLLPCSHVLTCSFQSVRMDSSGTHYHTTPFPDPPC
jgi:hypothetical protein